MTQKFQIEGFTGLGYEDVILAALIQSDLPEGVTAIRLGQQTLREVRPPFIAVSLHGLNVAETRDAYAAGALRVVNADLNFENFSKSLR